ncbi:SDR family oxidoreductase [Kitasatospora sp. CM 4170]|uniref:SDR family oxidoreductase n=1 Tax=Kitasatospora aburaviensis TaxID=67265 RepID=A0ABW1EVA3_9ACTN|nr:SDR family oxidoreductase [Kitasatospora sp. CM 4170]WNM49548.1 SDR family oxidoreductase [Kitasatospora sp. CM 4170]
MYLAIFGGTGHTGRHLVDRALGHGHRVTVLARDATKLPIREHLHVIEGDIRSAEAVARTVAGADAVISALGQRRWGTTVCTDAMRTVLPAMAAHGVRRLVALSNYGTADSRRPGVYATTVWIAIRSIMRDKERMEELIRGGDTEWTIVRPAALTDGPRTARYRTGTDLRLTFRSRVTYADVADFMLAQLDTDEYVHRAVAIGPVRD